MEYIAITAEVPPYSGTNMGVELYKFDGSSLSRRWGRILIYDYETTEVRVSEAKDYVAVATSSGTYMNLIDLPTGDLLWQYETPNKEQYACDGDDNLNYVIGANQAWAPPYPWFVLKNLGTSYEVIADGNMSAPINDLDSSADASLLAFGSDAGEFILLRRSNDSIETVLEGDVNDIVEKLIDAIEIGNISLLVGGQTFINLYAYAGGCWVELTKVDDVGDCVGPGDEITYTISYNYHGDSNCPDINDVNIIDYLPGEVEYVSSVPEPNEIVDSNKIIWNLGTLHPGDSGSVTLKVNVKPCPEPGGAITNHCEIRSGGQILRSAHENTPVCPGPTLNPSPAYDSNYPFDINNPSLKWTPGAMASYPPCSESNGNIVYFGTDYDEVEDADTSTPIIYRGEVKSTSQLAASYPLSSLSGDYNLVRDNTYYWRVDAVNDANVYTGCVWKFRFSHEYYVDTFDVKSFGPGAQGFTPLWRTLLVGNSSSQCSHTTKQNGATTGYGGGLSWDSVAKTMIYDYNNGYITGATLKDGFSEARVDYPAYCDWTTSSVPADPPKLLYLTFTGKAGNGIHPIYDRMYVLLEDADGHQGKIAKLPDVTDQAAEQLRTWRILLTDLNCPNDTYPQWPPVDLTRIRYMRLGFGDRCNMAVGFPPDPVGAGEGRVRFDNIRLSQPICNERYGPTADFYEDCFVDSNDLGVFVNDWLLTDTVLSYPDAVPPGVAPVLWYDFNETDGNLVHDSGSGGSAYDANVNMYIDGNNRVMHNDSTWDAGGHSGGCINLVYGAQSFVNVPAAAIELFANANGPNAVTFTCWINMDPCAVLPVEEPGLINAADKAVAPATEVIKILCPTPKPPVELGPRTYFEMTQLLQTEDMRPGDFGGRWNHYAFVKDADADRMAIYENGALIKELSGVAIDKPLLSVVPKVLKIGARYGNNWGFWPGKIDDFRMYNYALNANEIAYLATDGLKTRFIPLAEPTNLKGGAPILPEDEIVNFPDYAEFANQWLSEQFWP